MKFLSRLKSKHKAELYGSIEDLPIYNWNKLASSNDLTWLMKDRIDGYKITPDFSEAFSKIYNEYYTHFGINDNLKEYLRASAALEALRFQYVCDGDGRTAHKIREKEREFQKLFVEKAQDFEVQLEILTQWRGIVIDVHKTSVKGYYTILNMYMKEVDKQKKSNGREN